MTPPDRAVRRYRRLLRAFPPAVRAASGDDMARQFAEAHRLTASRPLARIRLWITATADAVWNGLLERLAIRSTVTDRAPRLAMSIDAPSPAARTAAFLREAATRDVRLAFRRLRRTPGFTLVATVTLALGIGATTAMFGVVHGVLLKPLPFPESERLVYLYQTWQGSRDVFTPPNLLDVQARTTTLSASAGYDTSRPVLTGAGEAVAVLSASVTAGFFDTLAVPPLLGRTLRSGENETGRTRVVVLSHAMWRSRFGARPDIVGQHLTLDGVTHEVVGVMPSGFVWPQDVECWRPAEYTQAFRVTNRGAWFLETVGRLKPGVTIDQAAAEMESIGRQLEREHPINTAVGMTAGPLLERVVGDSRDLLLVLLAAVAFVLVIACANVANLTLARASAREDEMAVRIALGAGRLQIARQLGVESAMLAVIGGVAGLALAAVATRALVAFMPPGMPRVSTIGIDPTVVLFAAAATLVTGVMFGLAPAMQVSGRSVAEALHERGRSGTASRRGRRTRSVLVIVETALAVVLLAGAGLLLRSFVKLTHVDPGFRVDRAVTFSLALPAASYPDDARRGAFHDRLRTQLEALPGVEAVGGVLVLPPGPPVLNLSFDIAGRPPRKPGEDETLEVRVADTAYFGVMGIPIVRGRGFEPTDRVGSTPVALLTETAVRQYFKDEDPIGRRITLGWRRGDSRVSGEVVGVVADVKAFGLDREAPPQMYVPLAQVPVNAMSWVVRTAVDPESMFSAVRGAVAAIDPNLPVNRTETLAGRVRESIARQRFSTLLLSLFAGVALLLAAVGIFGVLSYLVSQRTREFGVRIALGAQAGAVVRMVMQQALVLALAGIAIGTAGALAVGRLMGALLFELSPADPLSFAAAAAGLLLVALIAAWFPAHRATAADPMRALRE